MPKFVLIDHSIIGVGGHYFEYARHVLEAAEEAGYESVLVVNRRFQIRESLRWRVHALYKCGFWLNLSRPAWYERLIGTAKSLRNVYLRCRTRIAYSEASLLWLARRQPGAYLRSRALTAEFSLFWIPLIIAAVMAKCTIAAARVCRDMVPLRGYFSRVRAAFSRIVAGLVRTFSRLISRNGWPWRLAVDRYRLQQFKKSTLQLACLESLSPGDVVLLPTVSELELAALVAILRRSPALSQARWHLIFRRNIFPGRQQVEFSASPDLTALRGIFQSCTDLEKQGTLAFYTDTNELTEQYNLISGAPFKTLPIPHTQAPRGNGRVSVPTRITYLGDARGEKGYHHLPRIVGDLLRDCISRGKAAFVIQSNYNVPRGEPSAIVALSQLKRYASPNLTLFESPLDSNSYWNLIHSSDVSLLPYDRENYYARSSGILTESLAAGVPVLVPAGTWMSRQIIDEIYRHRLLLRDRLPVVGSFAAGELKPRVDGCPNAVVRNGDDWWICGGLRWTSCRVRAPQSQLMLLSVSLSEARPSDLLDVRVLQYSANRLLLSKSLHYMEQHREACRAALLVPVNTRADQLRIGFRNAIDQRRLVVSDARIDFLATSSEGERVPSGSVGLVYRSVEDIAGLLREMIEHREHYRQSARHFSRQWLRRHNAANFIETLQPAAEFSSAASYDASEFRHSQATRQAA